MTATILELSRAKIRLQKRLRGSFEADQATVKKELIKVNSSINKSLNN